MRKLVLFLVLLMVVGTIPLAMADDGHHDKNHRLRTRLSGYNEVHFVPGPPAALRGAISTEARGKFTAKIDENEQVIEYELRYEGLEGGSVSQAHIHFGQKHTVGGIVVWLCQTAGTPAPPAVADVNITPLCPGPVEGKVTGKITPAQILPQALQGFNGGNFDELVRALRAGAAYVNVHSLPDFGPGEIRGQLKDGDED
jgi:hypothetical protein